MKDRDLILDLANSEAGRFLIGEKGKEPIIKVTPNSYHKFIGFNGKKPILQAVFFLDNHIEQIFAPIIEKQRIASDKYLDRILEDKYKSFLHFAELEKSKYLPQIYLAQSTFNPNGAGNGNIVVDNGGDWATVRGGTTGTASSNPSSGNVYASQLTSRSIGRGFLPFNTASLSGGTLIAGANTVAINITATPGGIASQLDVFKSTQASNTALVNDDYNNVTFTDGGNVAIANGFTGVKTITLNGTGEGYIDFTGGYTPLGVMEDHDITNTDPNPSDYRITMNFAGGATPPVLTVNYTPAPSAGEENSYFL